MPGEALTRRAHTKKNPYSAAIKESSFQARVVQCATMNGWCILAEDCMPEHSPKVSSFLLRFFRTLQTPLDWLLLRKNARFTLAYHTHDSRRSKPGFPDLVLVHPKRELIIFAELKRDGEYPTTEQRLWLAALSCVAAHAPRTILVRLWKPSQWEQIVEDLGGIDSRLFL